MGNITALDTKILFLVDMDFGKISPKIRIIIVITPVAIPTALFENIFKETAVAKAAAPTFTTLLPIRIVERSNSYKMDVAPDYQFLINKLATGNAEFTKAEQETLAIIAYKQPVKQSIVIKIRGNKAYDHIKKFRGLGLVTTKREGHTLILNLSEEFYEYFNVHNKKNDE